MRGHGHLGTVTPHRLVGRACLLPPGPHISARPPPETKPGRASAGRGCAATRGAPDGARHDHSGVLGEERGRRRGPQEDDRAVRIQVGLIDAVAVDHLADPVAAQHRQDDAQHELGALRAAASARAVSGRRRRCTPPQSRRRPRHPAAKACNRSRNCTLVTPPGPGRAQRCWRCEQRGGSAQAPYNLFTT